MRKNQVFKLISLISFFMICLTGCSINSDDPKSVKDKTDEEISFIEDEIFTIVNKYVKDEYKNETGVLNWEDINKDSNKIQGILDTILVDLTELEISNEELIKLRNEVNNLFISISNEDEYNLLQKSSYIYSLLPTYMEKYSQNKNKIDIMKLKSLVLSGMIQANFLEWDNAKNTVLLAENKYKEMMDNVDYMKEYSYNLNKVYILLEEFKNAVELEENQLAKQKYINFIEKI